MGLYFGSVRFFKHLIILTISLVIVGLAATAAALAFQNYELRNRLLAGEAAGEPLPPPAELSLPRPETIDPPVQEPPEEPEEPEDAPLTEEDFFPLAYQALYPDLYCDTDISFAEPDPKTIYLTIDDGPSAYTGQFLNTLARYDIKATFFLIGRNVSGYESLLARMVEEGHTIGVHSYSHEFERVYASVESFLDDFAEASRIIEDASGVMPTIFRFPGGSVNNFNLTVYQEIIAEMLRRGYIYYDWNISAGDATNAATESSVTRNVLSTYAYYEHGIILSHERGITLRAMDRIIPEIKGAGYTFAALDRSVKPVVFAYPRYSR